MQVSRFAQSEKGTIFITTMVSLFMMVLVGSSIFSLTSKDMHFVKRLNKSLQAKHLADAGLARALSSLDSTFATSSSFGSTSLGEGTYSYTVSTTGGRTLVNATGTVDGVVRTSTAEVQAPGIGALDYAIAAGGNATIDTGTASSPGVITGDVYSGGNASLDGASNGPLLTITGAVDAGGSITASGSVSVSGGQAPNFSGSANFPSVSYNYYQTIAQANGFYYNANRSYTNAAPIPAAPAGGVIFVNGNIDITGTQSTTSCIVATGNITISKSGSTYPRMTFTHSSTYPSVLCQGNFTYSSNGNGGAYLTVDGLIYTGGNFTYSNGNHSDFTLTGALAAQGNVTISPTAHNDLVVTYSAPNPPGFTSTAADFEVLSYNR